MNWIDGWKRLTGAIFKRTPADDDPADMGTAFGLDASLETTPHMMQMSERSENELPNSWVQRLVRRPQR